MTKETAMKILKELHGKSLFAERTALETIVPELTESEDERIRKAIIDFLWKEKIFLQEVHSSVENNPKYRFVMDAIAWLEKQKSVGEIVERCKNSWYNEGKIAGQFEGITDDEKYNQGWHDALEKQGEQPSAIRWYDASLIPQEMEELLVEWDSEDATWHEIAFYHADTKTFWNGTRQVKNVTRWCYITDLLEKQGEQKQEWSEEDEGMKKNIEGALDCYEGMVAEDWEKKKEWLKSLKTRTAWKPNEKQIHAFEQVYEWYNNNFAPSETLTSLYNDLKKL